MIAGCASQARFDPGSLAQPKNEQSGSSTRKELSESPCGKSYCTVGSMPSRSPSLPGVPVPCERDDKSDGQQQD